VPGSRFSYRVVRHSFNLEEKEISKAVVEPRDRRPCMLKDLTRDWGGWCWGVKGASFSPVLYPLEVVSFVGDEAKSRWQGWRGGAGTALLPTREGVGGIARDQRTDQRVRAISVNPEEARRRENERTARGISRWAHAAR